MYFFSSNKNTKQMYTAAVYNVVFGKLNKIPTPYAALYMYLGSKKGEIPYGLATFCIRSNDISPTLLTLLL